MLRTATLPPATTWQGRCAGTTRQARTARHPPMASIGTSSGRRRASGYGDRGTTTTLTRARASTHRSSSPPARPGRHGCDGKRRPTTRRRAKSRCHGRDGNHERGGMRSNERSTPRRSGRRRRRRRRHSRKRSCRRRIRRSTRRSNTRIYGTCTRCRCSRCRRSRRSTCSCCRCR